MQIKPRDTTIDFLRGLAVLAMIMIHTNYYFLSDPFSLWLWQYLQFAVPVFVYCSSYLFFTKPFTFELKNILAYLKKRFLRMLIPYYIFLIIFMYLNHLKDPTTPTMQYIIDSLTLRGGVEINWLVLLFLQFSFIMPLILYLYQRKKMIFWIYTMFSLGVAIALIIIPSENIIKHLPYAQTYRYIMWLPWSILCLFAILHHKLKDNKYFLPSMLILSFGVFLLGYFLRLQTNLSPALFDNKYPPNLYFLSFGIFGITGLSLLNKFRLIPSAIRTAINFLSLNSYSLYFIHYCILHLSLYVIKKYPFNWLTFFLFVFMLSVLVQWVYKESLRLRGNFRKK